jgi:hypothetical protein
VGVGGAFVRLVAARVAALVGDNVGRSESGMSDVPEREGSTPNRRLLLSTRSSVRIAVAYIQEQYIWISVPTSRRLIGA